MGRALTEAGRGGGLTESDFWYGAAAKLITPHLFAAGKNGYTMEDVVRWIKTQEEFEVRSLLQATGHEQSIVSAEAEWKREVRARSSIYTTAEQVLRVFDFENTDVLKGPFLDIGSFLGSTSDTIYVCAPPDEQEEYQPIFTGLARTVLRAAYMRNTYAAGISEEPDGRSLDDRPASCPLLLLLDEAGNIAPLRNLDTLATTAAGTRVQLVSIFHDISQIEALYGVYAARSIVNNHSALVVLPGCRDVTTLQYVEALLRGERVANSVESKWSGPRPIRSMKRGQTLLIYRHLRPIVLNLRSKFTSEDVRGKVGSGAQFSSDRGVGSEGCGFE